MAENKLTDKHLRNLKPLASEQLFGDGGGLWIRVLPIEKGGAINFYYRFTYEGKERRFNCGSYPECSLAQARLRRAEARAMVKSGIDPVIKGQLDRATRSAEQAVEKMEKTVSDLLSDWKRVYLIAHRKDGGDSVEATMRVHVIPLLGTMKARDVRLPHVVQVIDKIIDDGHRRMANMVLSLMRQMFRHGLGRGIVDTDPTLALSRKQAGGKETPGERNFSFDEIKELTKKLPASGLHRKFQSAIWLLLATGTRVGELIKAKWSEIDMRAKTWVIPVENSKNGREHLIHLSDFALKQMKELRSLSDASYVLGGRSPEISMSDKTISKAVRDRIRTKPLRNRTQKVATLVLSGGEWSPHDLRRTMASRMGDLDIEPYVIERCLNHVQQGIVSVYQRQEYIPQRKKAFEKWGNKLASLTNTANRK